MSGVYCYYGVTESGKTTLALKHMAEDVARDGRPTLILDCMPARNLRDKPHEKDRGAVFEKLYGEGRHAVYTPRDEEDLALVFSGIHDAATCETAPKRVHVLWDEAAIHQSPQYIHPEIAKALRGHQHNECTFRIVSQAPKDFNGTVFLCMPEVYCFCLEREADLDRVRRECGFDPAQVKAQGQGQFLTFSRNRFRRIS